MHNEATNFDQLIEGSTLFADPTQKRLEILATAMPPLAASYFTNSIIVNKRYHYYEYSYRAESLEFFLSRSECQGLALALLAIVMRLNESFSLQLRHPDSQIQSVRVARPKSELNRLGLHYVGTQFVHLETAAMAELTSQARMSDKPIFRLGPSAPHIKPKDWEKRDAVEVDASDIGLLLLAQMLLNLGRSTGHQTELELLGSGDSGESSVGPRSAEARFWLRGSIASPV